MIDSERTIPNALRTVCASVTLAFVCAARASADDVRAYAALSETDTASGVLATRDVLVLRTGNDGASLSVVTGNVPTAPVTVAVGADGELEGESLDASAICYNMAASVEHAVTSHASPVVLYVALGGHSIPVVLNVDANETGGLMEMSASGRTRVALPTGNATAAGDVTVDARIESSGGLLRRATFVAVTSTASPATPLVRNTCAIADVRATPPVPTVAVGSV